MRLSTADLFKHLNNATDQTVRLEGETLQKLQTVILSIAEDMIAVCEEEHIAYHLTGGSALGAVRHQGFIPWDDDFDIDILGSDFDRFVSAFSGKYGDRYQICTCRTPNYGILINRVRLKKSVFRTREDIASADCGIFVDFARIENTFNRKPFRALHGFFCLGFGFLLSCRNFYQNRALMTALGEDNPEAMRTFRLKIFVGRLLSFLSVERWAAMTQAVYGLCKNNHSKYVTVPAGRKHFFGELRLRADFVETADARFEGHVWKIPKDYDGYLKSMYGPDYLSLPPEEDRETHVVLELKFPESSEEEAK